MTSPSQQAHTFQLEDGRQLEVMISEYSDGLTGVEAFVIQPDGEDLTLVSAYFPKASWGDVK